MFSQIPTPSIDGSIARVRRAVSYTAAATMVTVSLAGAARVGAQNAATLTNPVPARTDPYVERTRVLVMTDIANEPDDQMSMVRFLVYANQFDIEGLVATTFTWMRNRVRPDVIRTLLDAYEAVQPNLQKHQPGFPAAAALRGIVVPGQTGYGMAAVGPDKMSPGAELIIKAAEKADARPLWISAWGGTNTLAQALLHVRTTRSAEQLATFVSRLRVYSISDQDDAGPWLRREFPELHYIVMPSTPDGDQYAFATWTGPAASSAPATAELGALRGWWSRRTCLPPIIHR